MGSFLTLKSHLHFSNIPLNCYSTTIDAIDYITESCPNWFLENFDILEYLSRTPTDSDGNFSLISTPSF